MGTKPVRVPEEQHGDIEQLAAILNVPMSRAAQILIETGLDNFSVDDHLTLDSDLKQEYEEAMIEAESGDEAYEAMTEIHQRQVDRNRERSEIDLEA
jgi:hypothetical protein